MRRPAVLGTVLALLTALAAPCVPAGAHGTAVGRNSGQAPRTVGSNWTALGAGPSRSGVNPYENQLTPTTVSQLSESWRSAAHGSRQIGSPAVANGNAYAGFTDGSVVSFTGATGAVRWTAHTVSAVYSSPAVAGHAVYVGSDDGYLYSFNAATGALLWRTFIGSAIRSSPAVSGGLVYVGTFSDDLRAVNAATGAPVWSFTTGAAIFSSPAVANGIVYVGSNDGKVYAVDASTGSPIWTGLTGAYVTATPAVVGGRVYIGSNDGRMYAFAAADGSRVWVSPAGGSIGAGAAVANGLVYYGDGRGVEHAVRAGFGAPVWSATVSSAGLDTATTYADGVLYVSDKVNTVALDAGDGGVLDRLPASGPYGDAVPVDGGLLLGDYAGGFVARYTLGAG